MQQVKPPMKKRPANPYNVRALCLECGASGEPVDVFDSQQRCHNPECDPSKVRGMSKKARFHARKAIRRRP